MVIPYVEFSRQVRGIRPMLMDTSALIDGRINSFGQTGFLDAPLIVPQFVFDEMHRLSDSSDATKRERGRRGLNNLRLLQNNSRTTVTIEELDQQEEAVDQALLSLAADKNFRIVTTDYNLARVADIRDVSVLNLNDLSNLLQGHVVPGESMPLEIVREGESDHQGVGYLPDGTMVVVEHARSLIGQQAMIVINNSVQTTAGRLVFARLLDQEGEGNSPAQMGDAATSQSRHPSSQPPEEPRSSRGRNPRR